jgi:hypothetical protein
MAQTFPRSANSIAKISIVAVVLLGGAATMGAAAFFNSQYVTGVNVIVEQPVPFSHAHHVTGIGIDCRYCHTSVETSAFAGLPSTRTCMTCHSQVWKDSPMLAPVRDSYVTDRPIEWNRVYDLPDFAYFNHSIHVNKGVGCSSCHGRIDEMQLTFKSASLYMEWCLRCHRNPASVLREKDQIFNMDWKPDAHQAAKGAELMKVYNTPSTALLTSCSTCHR